ncbi:MAG: PTS glucose transporter subunit IIA [Streptococcaceae bacterium]|jgi:glucose-specific phosphotransferase system IIA component|nr:PTS glucose transporter subunit IIA [Streptococcaceae bacterium]
MFGFGKKKELKEDATLYAPIAGEVIALSEVSDPVFSKEIMGKGYAVEPTDGKLVSPVAGTVTLAQGHALGFTRADGLEVLLHVGIDTVSLNGAPFKFSVKQGDVVDGGDAVGTVDWAQVEAAGLKKTTMVVITNTADKLGELSVTPGTATTGAAIGNATAK